MKFFEVLEFIRLIEGFFIDLFPINNAIKKVIEYVVINKLSLLFTSECFDCEVFLFELVQELCL